MISDKSKLLAVALMLASICGPTVFQTPVQAKQEHLDVAIQDEVINNVQYQVTRTLIHARPEQVYQVLTDFAASPKIFPNVKQCRVITDGGNTKRVHYQIRPTGCMATFEYDLELREVPNKLIEFHRVGGDFKAVDGFWKLEAAECGRGTIVTYASHVNGGIFLPQALIKRQTRLDFPQVMAALKNQAETTTQIAARGHITHSAN